MDNEAEARGELLLEDGAVEGKTSLLEGKENRLKEGPINWTNTVGCENPTIR